MFKAYTLQGFTIDYQYISYLSEAKEYVRELNEEKLSKMETFFMNRDLYEATPYVDTLDAGALANIFFPQRYTAKVFISHSHSDINYASYIAYLLHKKGIEAFIDAHAWDNITNLLKIIDGEFCRSDNDPTLYSYDKRNISTSNVHMILFSALINMIDTCECFLFLDTQNSIKETALRAETYSPWIMGELLVSSIIQIKDPRPRRLGEIRAGMGSLTEDAAPSFLHPARIDHLEPLSWQQFWEWYQCAPANAPERALDQLYGR